MFSPPTEFCYVLRSCSKRMVDNLECTLGKNNFLVLLYLDISDKEKGFDFFFEMCLLQDIKMFVPRLEECRRHCLRTEGCRYYYW